MRERERRKTMVVKKVFWKEMGRIEGGERGCGRASWVDLGFGCREMGREGKGRLMLDGWMGLLAVSRFREGD